MKNIFKNISSLVLISFLITVSAYAVPSIIIQPVNKTTCAGSNTFFSIVDSSSCIPNHQWQILTGSVWTNLNNTGIYTGATSDTLILSSITTSLNGVYYRCIISTTTCGSITSDSVKLTVNTIPVITTQPVDAVYSGYSSMLNIVATGGSLNYQWQYNNSNLTSTISGSYLYFQGLNSDTLFSSLNNFTCGPYCGLYESGKYRCYVNNNCGADTSQTAYSYINYIKWQGVTSSSWSVASNWENKNLIYNMYASPPYYTISTTSAVPNGAKIFISPNASYSPIVSGKVSIDYLLIPTGKTLSMNSNSDTILLGAILNSTNNMNGNYDGSKGTTITQTPSNYPFAWNELPSGIYYRVYFVNSPYGADFYGITNTIIKNNITSICSFFIYDKDLIIDTNATYNIPSVYTCVTSYNGIPFTGKFVVRNVGGANRTGPVLFPMSTTRSFGTATLNAPLTITNTGTPDEFRVRVIDSVTNSYSGNIPIGSKLTNNVVGKTWFIEEGTQGGSNVTIAFSWDSVSEKTGFTRNNSYVSNYSSSGWIPGNASTSILSNGFYSKTITGLSSFGTFGIGSGGALPVELISFDGKIFNGNALLNWETSSEINNSYFNVLRSTDNINFEIAGKVKGNINSNKINYYSFEDKNSEIYFQQNQIVYYRLNQVDLDGLSSSESKTIALHPQRNSDVEILFEPNPFTESSSIKIKANENKGTIKISVTDISGRKLIEKKFTFCKGENLVSIDELGGLNSGLYFVQIDINSRTQNIKILKQ